MNEIGSADVQLFGPIRLPGRFEISVIEPRKAVDPEFVAVSRVNLVCCATVSRVTVESKSDWIVARIVDT